MKKATGKSNLSIINDYLNGVRPFTQVGYDSNLNTADRKEGEEWEDSQGKRWIKKNGYKQRISKNASIIYKELCNICNADIKWGSPKDHEFFKENGMCYDCTISFVSKMKFKGIYENYQKYKIYNNQCAIIKDLKDKILESIEYLNNYDGQIKFLNEDGSTETWIDDSDKKNTILKHLNDDLLECNNKLENLRSELTKINYNPDVEFDIRKLVLDNKKNKNNERRS